MSQRRNFLVHVAGPDDWGITRTSRPADGWDVFRTWTGARNMLADRLDLTRLAYRDAVQEARQLRLRDIE